MALKGNARTTQDGTGVAQVVWAGAYMGFMETTTAKAMTTM